MSIPAILLGIIALLSLLIAVLVVSIKTKDQNEKHLKETIAEYRTEISEYARRESAQKGALDEANKKKASLDAGTDGERFDASLDVLSHLSKRYTGKP